MTGSPEKKGGIYERLRSELLADRPLAMATVIGGGELGAKMLICADGTVLGSVGDKDLDRVVQRDARAGMSFGQTSVRTYGPAGQARLDELRIFIEVFGSPPRMVIFGAVDFTASLVRCAKLLGYYVLVADPRPAFATEQRFPEADEIRVAWPDKVMADIGPELGSPDAVCVLTHDPKFDVPALVGAVATEVGYIGAMGSRKTAAKRNERLQEEGFSDAEIGRIMAPIGLDIGSRTPAEAAISICAEIIASATGHGGGSLRDTSGPIHTRSETR